MGRNPTIRNKYLKQHTICELCSRAATADIHHIIPYSFQFLDSTIDLDTEENIIAVCRTCHAKLTNKRLLSMFGQRRACGLYDMLGGYVSMFYKRLHAYDEPITIADVLDEFDAVFTPEVQKNKIRDGQIDETNDNVVSVESLDNDKSILDIAMDLYDKWFLLQLEEIRECDDKKEKETLDFIKQIKEYSQLGIDLVEEIGIVLDELTENTKSRSDILGLKEDEVKCDDDESIR